MTRRFEASQKKESKFANVRACPNFDDGGWPAVYGQQAEVYFKVYSLDYDGVTYDLNDVEAYKALVDALKKDGYEFDEELGECDLSDYHIKIDRFDVGEYPDVTKPVPFDLQGEVHSINTDKGIVDTQNVRGIVALVTRGEFELAYIISAWINDPPRATAYCFFVGGK